MVSVEPDGFSSVTPARSPWWSALWQRLSVKAMVVLAIAMFALAVGVDALQHPAAAADLMAAPTTLGFQQASDAASAPVPPSPRASRPTYLNPDLQTAQRLKASDLTSATLTRSRLTSAHLFTSVAP